LLARRYGRSERVRSSLRCRWLAFSGSKRPASPRLSICLMHSDWVSLRPDIQTGKTVRIEYRYANFKPELLLPAARDLVRLNVDVIFAPGGPVVVAAGREATSSIPIVAHDLDSDPVAKGWVKSLPRPGGNRTGFFLDTPEMSGKQVGLLREVLRWRSMPATAGLLGVWAPPNHQAAPTGAERRVGNGIAAPSFSPPSANRGGALRPAPFSRRRASTITFDPLAPVRS
jgi:putative tryptophan/tyrosine transport system substrate-binding protein